MLCVWVDYFIGGGGPGAGTIPLDASPICRPNQAWRKSWGGGGRGRGGWKNIRITFEIRMVQSYTSKLGLY